MDKPETEASYATPTPHTPLLAEAAARPAIIVPCASRPLKLEKIDVILKI